MTLEADRALRALAQRQGGLATWRQARDDCGVPDSTLRWRVRKQLYVVVRPRVLALPGVVMNHNVRAMAAVLSAGEGALACCGTAAALLDLWDRPFPAQVHVLVPTTRRRKLPGLRVHRSDIVTGEDRAVAGFVPCTSAARTIVDLSGSVTDADLELLILDAVRRRLTSFEELRRCADRLSRAPGTKRLRAILDVYDQHDVQRLASIIEAAFLALVRRLGLPMPAVNRDVIKRNGVVRARVDFRWANAQLTVEVDGLRFHSTRAQKRYDDRRQNELIIAGERVLRYDLYAIRHEADRVGAEILAILTPSLAV